VMAAGTASRAALAPVDAAMFVLILLAGLIVPFLAPAYTFQIAVLYLMVVFALTWDIMGGQMGYNSLGNIFFFGAGMYVCSVVQIGLFYDVAEYTAHFGAVKVDFTPFQYYTGLTAGLAAAALASVAFAVALGWIVFGLRGPYFAIGTLGITIAAGELVGAFDYVGGGGGLSLPVYPGDIEGRSYFFYILNFILAIATFLFAPVHRWRDLCLHRLEYRVCLRCENRFAVVALRSHDTERNCPESMLWHRQPWHCRL
jgi:branched-chain amino acid transport system permease protein